MFQTNMEYEMYNKSKERTQWRQTKNNLAQQINQLLFERKLTIVDVAGLTRIPLHILKNISLGYETYNNWDLRALAQFLNKRIKIELVD